MHNLWFVQWVLLGLFKRCCSMFSGAGYQNNSPQVGVCCFIAWVNNNTQVQGLTDWNIQISPLMQNVYQLPVPNCVRFEGVNSLHISPLCMVNKYIYVYKQFSQLQFIDGHIYNNIVRCANNPTPNPLYLLVPPTLFRTTIYIDLFL